MTDNDEYRLRQYEALLRGHLRPWLEINRLEDKFITEQMPEIPVFPSQLYQFDFYRFFSRRTEYYYRLIVGEANRIGKEWVGELKNEPDKRIVSYSLTLLLNRRIPTLLRDTAQLLREGSYNLNQINAACDEKFADCDGRTEAYIFHLLKVALIKIYLEIQNPFMHLLGNHSMSIEDLYLQYFGETLPQRTFLLKIEEDIVSAKSSCGKRGESLSGLYHSFHYKGYDTSIGNLTDLCDGLKKGSFIDETTSVTDFKKLFSGKPIRQQVRWSGTYSDLYYFIKLIYQIHSYVADMKQHQWEVACQCFIRLDGTHFDRDKLKAQKMPRSTKVQLEKLAKLLSG